MATMQKGSQIGPYIVGKTLGVGSTGTVYLGTHVATKSTVAIKMVARKNLAGRKDSSEEMEAPEDKTQRAFWKIEREISLMKLINHPHILGLIDVIEIENNLCLILEHVEGGELFECLVKRGRLPEADALDYFQQIILGVDYCHKHRIYHRDLKPENILLDNKNQCKIADFGMAKLQQEGKVLQTSCGSPHYAAPEVVRGLNYDGAPADIWSCGVILFALLTGSLPFDDPNIKKLLQRVKSGVFVCPDYIPPLAQDLITRMITVDISKRIKMKDIISHPWFTGKKLSFDNDSLIESIWNQVPVTLHNIEEELVQVLGYLGFTDREMLLRSLHSTKINEEKRNYYMLKCRDDAGNRLGSKKKSEKESKTHVASTDAKNSKNLFFKWPPPAPSRKTLEWFAKGSPGDVSDKLVLGLNNLKVKVQKGSTGLLKCKYTPHNGILPIKFKIDIQPNATKVGIRVTHQQGPEKSFEDITLRLTCFLTYQPAVLAHPNQEPEFDDSPAKPIVIC